MKLVSEMESLTHHDLHAGDMKKLQSLDITAFNAAYTLMGAESPCSENALYRAIMLYNEIRDKQYWEEITEAGPTVAVDLDGTLAHFDTYKGPEHIGEPVIPMVERIKKWLAAGKKVKIFTARCFHLGAERNVAIKTIEDYCQQHIGQVLPVTNIKDFMITEFYDDRAVQVEVNTGRIIE